MRYDQGRTKQPRSSRRCFSILKCCGIFLLIFGSRPAPGGTSLGCSSPRSYRTASSKRVPWFGATDGSSTQKSWRSSRFRGFIGPSRLHRRIQLRNGNQLDGEVSWVGHLGSMDYRSHRGQRLLTCWAVCTLWLVRFKTRQCQVQEEKRRRLQGRRW